VSTNRHMEEFSGPFPFISILISTRDRVFVVYVFVALIMIQDEILISTFV
jgi:hypothetical protein